MNAITIIEPPSPARSRPNKPSTIARRPTRSGQASKATSTIRAYRADLARLRELVRRARPPELPASPDTVADHLAWCATEGRLARPASAAGPPRSASVTNSPVRYPDQLGDGARGDRGHPAHARSRPRHRKQAVTAERLADMLKGLPDTLAGKRDRALLALGFAGAFRRIGAGRADGRGPDRGSGRLPGPDPAHRRPISPARGKRSPSRGASGCGPWRRSRRG